MRVRCQDCGNEQELTNETWRCDCGGTWEVADLPEFDPQKIDRDDYSIWRYGSLLGLDVSNPIKRMGVGWTPLVPIRLFDMQCALKLEYLSPSGSFKDRGVNAMINQIIHMGVETVVEDSSGNAGASLAAHAARFGISAEIYVPEYASTAKQQQIRLYGASVKAISGPRSATEKAAQASIGGNRAYASHAFHPAYLAGQVTSAYELWEQLGGKAPDWILVPTAQGGQFLGNWFGFRQLLKAKLISRLPHLVAVQAAQIAPIHQAWTHGLDHIPKIDSPGQTLAEGVAIAGPVRGKRILQALRESNGFTLAIDEIGIKTAYQQAANLGYFVEPTSALVFAGLKHLQDQIPKEDLVVLSLTGNGLKGMPKDSYPLN
jgi:threonine synthase